MARLCRVCSTKTQPLISLGNIYLSEFYRNRRKPKRYPLKIVLCSSCKLVQLEHTTPSELLYTERYGYRSGINQTMRDHLKEIADSVVKYKGDKNITAVDIGANDGTLIANYPATITSVAVEPITKLAKLCKKYTRYVVNDYFSAQKYQEIMGDQKADVITAISCFYDIDTPNDFVSDLGSILKEDGIVIIQQNYLYSMLRQNAFDNIVHEHLEYYSLISLQNLLDRHNMEIFDVKLTDLNGGSFRTYIAFKGQYTIKSSVSKLLEQEKAYGLFRKKAYVDFVHRVRSIKKELKTILKRAQTEKKRVYIYGASTRGNTLLQYFQINNRLVQKAVERNPEKWGTYISSIGVPIISEEEARSNPPDYLLVLPWFFKEEFLVREKKFLENGGHFIFPLPDLHIV